jgi:hypothetical protein
MSDETNSVNNETINEVIADKKINNNLSLESLILLINTERLKFLQDKTNAEFKELKKRQDHVSSLHKLMKKINTNTSSSGDFDCSSDPELQQMLKDAKDLGVDMKDGQFKYGKDEKDRLMDNIRMTVDDFNVKNDMQLQTVNRLTNERYESYQMARSILKPLHDAKMKIAQGIRGS